MAGVQGSLGLCHERYLCRTNELPNKPTIEGKVVA